MTWTRVDKQEDLMCRYFVMQMVQLATRFERNANFIEYRNSFYSLLILLSKALDDYDSAENGNIPRARKMMPSSGDTLIKYFQFSVDIYTLTHTQNEQNSKFKESEHFCSDLTGDEEFCSFLCLFYISFAFRRTKILLQYRYS